MDDVGRVPGGTGLSQAEPVSRLGPSGFDPSRIERVRKRLTPAQTRNLFALSLHDGVWQTISEMRHNGATGSGMDLLYIYHSPRVCDRRWTKWGSERGQKRGEGFEYRITDLGRAVRAAIATEARRAETAQTGSVHEGAGRQASPKIHRQGSSHDA